MSRRLRDSGPGNFYEELLRGVQPDSLELTWVQDLIAGRLFIGGASIGGNLGDFTLVQLFNPAEARQALLVRGLIGTGSGTDPTNQLALIRDTAARANLSIQGVNTRFDLGDRSAEIRWDRTSTFAPGEFMRLHINSNVPVNLFSMPWFVALNPGTGLSAAITNTNQALAAAFVWKRLSTILPPV